MPPLVRRWQQPTVPRCGIVGNFKSGASLEAARRRRGTEWQTAGARDISQRSPAVLMRRAKLLLSVVDDSLTYWFALTAADTDGRRATTALWEPCCTVLYWTRRRLKVIGRCVQLHRQDAENSATDDRDCNPRWRAMTDVIATYRQLHPVIAPDRPHSRSHRPLQQYFSWPRRIFGRCCYLQFPVQVHFSPTRS